MSIARSDRAIGLPLGNLTSQLFSNVYLNEFDQFVKHTLKARYYIRYADDFVIFSEDKHFEGLTLKISGFLQTRLRLTLHPDKIFIKTLSQGLDFLGWVHFFEHRVLRTVTKKRMLKKLQKTRKLEAVASYLGLLKHGNAQKIRGEVLEGFK